MEKQNKEWHKDGNRTIYAYVFFSEVNKSNHYYDSDGSYEKVGDGFKPYFRNKITFKTEAEARKDVLLYAIKIHRREIAALEIAIGQITPTAETREKL
jgi:hypothetical protein